MAYANNKSGKSRIWPSCITGCSRQWAVLSIQRMPRETGNALTLSFVPVLFPGPLRALFSGIPLPTFFKAAQPRPYKPRGFTGTWLGLGNVILNVAMPIQEGKRRVFSPT